MSGRDRLWLDPRLTAQDTRTATSASKVTDGVGVWLTLRALHPYLYSLAHASAYRLTKEKATATCFGFNEWRKEQRVIQGYDDLLWIHNGWRRERSDESCTYHRAGPRARETLFAYSTRNVNFPPAHIWHPPH